METTSTNGPICPYCGLLLRQEATSIEEDGVVDGDTHNLKCPCGRRFITRVFIMHRYESSRMG